MVAETQASVLYAKQRFLNSASILSIRECIENSTCLLNTRNGSWFEAFEQLNKVMSTKWR